MKFSYAIFFFVLTIGAQFQSTQAAIGDALVHFKQTLDDAANALDKIDDDTPAINGKAELQRERRQAIDDLINNSDYDLNLNLEHGTHDMDNDLMHPLEGRAIKYENRNDDYKMNVNDQLNELVRANSRFQNLHRQLLNSFHNSNRNMKFDAELQKSKNKESKEGKLYTDKTSSKGEEKEKNTNKGKDSSNSYSNSNKNSKDRNFYNNFDFSNKDRSYLTNYNQKSNFGAKNAFNSGVNYNKDDTISSSYTPSFSNFKSMDNLRGNGKISNYHTNTGLNAGMESFRDSGRFNNDPTNIGLNGPASFHKAYVSCKPLSSDIARTKPDTSYLDITSGFHNTPQDRESLSNSNLDTNLLLEANTYRNAMQMQQNTKENAFEELNEKRFDPEMHRMMEKIHFPHFRLDFESSMEDFERAKSNGDDDEPISYEKTIENIHFPSIVNDQFDLGRNDLSHEADYKLSKMEQEQSEPRKNKARSNDNNEESKKLKIPWKRSSAFNPMDEIKLKTSTRLMAKGLGPSLPSYALTETQNELQLDDAVKKLEKNFDAGNELGMAGFYRHHSLLSEDELDWLERLKNIEGAEERALTRLIHEGEDDAPKEEKEVKSVKEDKEKSDDNLLFGPTYSVLRKRRINEPAKYADSKDDEAFDLIYLSKLRPKNILPMETPILNEEEPSPAALGSEEDSPADARASDVVDIENGNDMDDAQELDDSELQEEDENMAEKTKRSLDTKSSGVVRDAREKESGEQKDKMSLKQDTSGSNVAKRRVKRVDVGNKNAKNTAVKEEDTNGVAVMALIKSEPKREFAEATNTGHETEKSAGRAKRNANTFLKSKIEKSGSEPLQQKILRRNRRDTSATKEIYDGDSLHIINRFERKRRWLNSKSKKRLKREAAQAKGGEEKQEKAKTEQIENVKGRKKDKQNVHEKEKEDAKKTTRCEKIEGNNKDHLVDKRAAHIVDDIDDNNSNNNRKILNTPLLLAERRNAIPMSAYEEHAFDDEQSETLNDAAVIAADRRAMNNVQAAYRRNSERARAINAETNDNYENLMERLRRISQRNRGRERSEFESSVSQFGDQVFDNLKQSDQNAHHFDGMPIDNLWYGHDYWEEDNNKNDKQEKSNQRNDEDIESKNEPNEQRTALTIKIEDGAIKSIERKDEPKKMSSAGVINPRESSEEDEDYNNGDDTSLSWFSKNKIDRNNNNTNSKTDEKGLVLKVNDQLLNCTAFNTLESFLKSVQQQSNVAGDGSQNSAGSDNSISKDFNVNCTGKDILETSRSGGEVRENERQGNDGKSVGKYGYGIQGGNRQGGSMLGGGMQGVGNQIGGGQKPNINGGMLCDSESGDVQEKNTLGCRNGDNERKSGNDKDGGDTGTFGIGGSGNGLVPHGGKCGLGGDQKPMKLNITINASVMGDQKAKHFFGNGTFKVQGEDRERRGITFPQFEEFKRVATKRKCPKPKVSCDAIAANSKGALEVVKSMFNMARCNPQMKPIWASLKRNQQSMKKAPPPEGGFEKMQKEDINHIEDMVEQAMEAIGAIIDDQVQQRSCIPLPPELKVLYENILEIYERNAAEGVREKRANVEVSPFDAFAKEIRLIDPNTVEERSRIVKKLLRQYDDLPIEEQQQMVGLRDNLQENLNFLETIKEDQTQRKREQMQQSAQEQQTNKGQQKTEQEQSLQSEQEQQQVQQLHQKTNNEGEDADTDAQTRWQRELVKKLVAEEEDDKEFVKAFNLSYTPEFLRLLKASEIMEEKEIKEAEGITDDYY
ncbi:probable WRKY transcription factor protein 1 [Eurosta solidaginis]|uniref:probable WRKY transcription factor protein 1 n=1 Tax=Eurosta solidaginis TaxID=178769 RepID=UPI003530B31B